MGRRRRRGQRRTTKAALVYCEIWRLRGPGVCVATSFYRRHSRLDHLPVGVKLDACGVGAFGTQSLSGPAELW